MPRPGPRPYECVKRAWHSDRHHPMRGSLIKEIFRVVNEIHSTATKKNKEWQDKLPIVVLKAEEIMYSKANSEAEYMDLKNLWDRANDAINTIIRRDESTETGVFLQPCIEAALNLGCTPRRASRSQRNNTQNYYLSATNQDSICNPSTNTDNKTLVNNPTNIPFIPHYSNFTKPNSNNSTPSPLDPHSPVVQNNHFALNKPSSLHPKNSPSGRNEALCSVYALHYGDIQSKPSNFHLGFPSKSNSNSVEPSEICVKKNTAKENFATDFENPLGSGCDLSLRLGPLVGPCISIENSWPHESDDVGSSTSQERSKLNDSSPKTDKSFSFILTANMGDPLYLDPGKWSSENEKLNEEKILRKRKAAVVAEDTEFSWKLEVPCKHFSGRMSNAGS